MFKEGDKVRIELAGEIKNGKLVLEGDIDLEGVVVEPEPTPPPKPKDPVPRPDVVGAVANYTSLEGATRGCEYVSPYYRNSKWYYVTSVVADGLRRLAVYNPDGTIRMYPYDVVNCTIHEDKLYTIELMDGSFEQYEYDLSITAAKTLAVTNRKFLGKSPGDVFSVDVNRDFYEKYDKFDGGFHKRNWHVNGKPLVYNLPNNYSIYTLTFDDQIGVAGIFRIDELSGRNQIGPIYPVWCEVDDLNLSFPFGFEESASIIGPAGDNMVVPGGRFMTWGKEYRFCLTFNNFLHTKWKIGAYQEAWMYSINKEKLEGAIRGV